MNWLQLSVIADKDAAESVSELMSSFGALSVTYSDAASQPLYEVLPNDAVTWKKTRVTGLFEPDSDPALIQGVIIQQMEESEIGHWQIEELEDQAWERAWMDYFKPKQFGARLWVCPIGQKPPVDDTVCVSLDPGLAFGTGGHPTTALCLEWLDRADIENRLVIDYGCGSGILAVAAALLGAKQVYATDLDPQALIAARDNAAKNHVESKMTCCPPDQLPNLQADILLANILIDPLVELADTLVRLVLPGGHLVLSGILEHQIRTVRSAYTLHCRFIDTTVRDEWVRLTGQKF